jgi:hypothetical protein
MRAKATACGGNRLANSSRVKAMVSTDGKGLFAGV